MTTHECDPLREWNKKHYPYVDIEIHNDGYFLYNGEDYFTVEVNFCAFCGMKL